MRPQSELVDIVQVLHSEQLQALGDMLVKVIDVKEYVRMLKMKGRRGAYFTAIRVGYADDIENLRELMVRKILAIVHCFRAYRDAHTDMDLRLDVDRQSG